MRKIYKTLKAAAENPDAVDDHGKLYAEAAEAYKLLFREMEEASKRYCAQTVLTSALQDETRSASKDYVTEIEWHLETLDFEPYISGYMWGSERNNRLIGQLYRIATIASKVECCEPGMSESFETAAGYLRRLFDLHSSTDADGFSTWPDGADDFTHILSPYWVDRMRTHV